MKGINKVILVGTVGKDPEIRSMPNGGQVASFSMATSEAWNDKATGEKREETEWHRIIMFGKLAEIVGQYVKKGSKLYIEGKLKTRSWEQDGVKRYATEIVAHELQMLDSKPTGQSEAPMRQAASTAPAAKGNNTPEFDQFDDDIPF